MATIDPRSWLADTAAGLRTSYLTWFFLGLLAIDLVVPDPLPFVDEAVLALGALLVARWRGRHAGGDKPPPKDVTPR